jgi:hypothetical protein
MQVTACTSFSIATSTEGVRIASQPARSPDGTKRNPGTVSPADRPIPGFAMLHPGYSLAAVAVLADMLPAGNKLTRHGENCVCRLCWTKRRMQMRAVQVRSWPAASLRLYGGVIIDR